MAQTASSLTADQVNKADEGRTKRVFIGFLSSILGDDQTYTTDDTGVANSTNQYVIANPDGTYSAVGKPQSNLNSASVAGLTLTPGLLLMIGAAFFLLKK